MKSTQNPPGFHHRLKGIKVLKDLKDLDFIKDPRGSSLTWCHLEKYFPITLHLNTQRGLCSWAMGGSGGCLRFELAADLGNILTLLAFQTGRGNLK